MKTIAGKLLGRWMAIAGITLIGTAVAPDRVRSENLQRGILPTTSLSQASLSQASLSQASLSQASLAQASLAQVLAQAQGGLIGRSWQLVNWGEPTALESPMPGTEITLGFAKRRISGSSGCNLYQGTYSTTGDRLEFGAIGATRKLCAQDISQQEFRYLSALEQVKAYTISPEGQLQLTYQVGEFSGILIFEPR